jgi:FkbM family methyltransferase
MGAHLKKVAKETLQKTRRYVDAARGRDVIYRVQLWVKTERHGSDYGGWTLCPTILTKDSIVYSMGVGKDISFDVSLIQSYGLRVHAFDPTPRSIAWIQQQRVPSSFVFHAYGIAEVDGTATFYPPPNPNHVSHTMAAWSMGSERTLTVPVRRLATIMRELGHRGIDVLKLDIEGAEYAVLDDLIRSHIKPAQILVEFHHRFDAISISQTVRSIESLNEYGYKIFAISPNGEEYSFIRDN